MARTKGAMGRAEGDSVKALVAYLKEQKLGKVRMGCAVCNESGDEHSVSKYVWWGKEPLSRMPYEKGMTKEQIQMEVGRTGVVCKKCFRGWVYTRD